MILMEVESFPIVAEGRDLTSRAPSWVPCQVRLHKSVMILLHRLPSYSCHGVDRCPVADLHLEVTWHEYTIT